MIPQTRAILQVAPAFSKLGIECWTNVSPADLENAVAQAGYADGATPADVTALEKRFPVDDYVWILIRDY